MFDKHHVCDAYLRPLEPGWLVDALGFDAIKTVGAYSIWGGVPRYWELAKQFSSV